MEGGQKHSIKQKLLQLGAIVLTLCYLFAPFKNELISVLHDVSHHLKMPANMISHSSTSADFYHGSSAIISKSDHGHYILDALSNFLDGTESSDKAPISKELKIKIDKHFSEHSHTIKNDLCLSTEVSYPPMLKTKPLRYSTDINPPPDLSFSV